MMAHSAIQSAPDLGPAVVKFSHDVVETFCGTKTSRAGADDENVNASTHRKQQRLVKRGRRWSNLHLANAGRRDPGGLSTAAHGEVAGGLR